MEDIIFLKFKEEVDTYNRPYDKAAVYITSKEALEIFKDEYYSLMVIGEIPVNKWFILSYRDDRRSDKKIVEDIVLIDEFVTSHSELIQHLSEELVFALNIMTRQ